MAIFFKKLCELGVGGGGVTCISSSGGYHVAKRTNSALTGLNLIAKIIAVIFFI